MVVVLVLWIMRWTIPVQVLWMQSFYWGRKSPPLVKSMIMWLLWSGTTSLEKFIKTRLNMLVQLLIVWEPFQYSGKMFFMSVPYVTYVFSRYALLLFTNTKLCEKWVSFQRKLCRYVDGIFQINLVSSTELAMSIDHCKEFLRADVSSVCPSSEPTVA